MRIYFLIFFIQPYFINLETYFINLDFPKILAAIPNYSTILKPMKIVGPLKMAGFLLMP
jgi:hypothetical protein